MPSFSYGRDAADLLTSMTPTGVIGPAESYTYSKLNQLKSVNGAGYSYDASDNLTALPAGTQAFDAANEVIIQRHDPSPGVPEG